MSLAVYPKLSSPKALYVAGANGFDCKILGINVGEKSPCDHGVAPLNEG
jgi:hypothetical protein